MAVRSSPPVLALPGLRPELRRLSGTLCILVIGLIVPLGVLVVPVSVRLLCGVRLSKDLLS